MEEGELSDQEHEISATDPDLALSEEQNYRETMSGIRSFMGWTHIPEVDSTTSKSEDNPFAGPKSQPTRKVSVTIPTDEWLCSKMGKLNLTLKEWYPLRNSVAGGLLKDQFVRPPPPPQVTVEMVSLCTEPEELRSRNWQDSDCLEHGRIQNKQYIQPYSQSSRHRLNPTGLTPDFPGQFEMVGKVSPRSVHLL